MDRNLQRFTALAIENGLVVCGVKASRISDRGFGVVSERPIKVGEKLVEVPLQMLLTTNCIPKSFKDSIKFSSVHGLLATFLSQGSPDGLTFYDSWKSTWPTLPQFRDSMPLLWVETVTARQPLNLKVLPASLRLSPERTAESKLLASQREKLRRDWEAHISTSPDADYDCFTYYWLIINTRSFYYDLPLETTPKAHEDKMALCPFVDYFNHSDHGCEVGFGETGFTVTADRDYEVGEELYVSYGSHGNDTLWVEYGFILERNKWDYVPLDTRILEQVVDGSSIDRLKDLYYGDYRLTEDGLCHRAQVAIRTQTLQAGDWRRFTEGKKVRERKDVALVNTWARQYVLEPTFQEAKNAMLLLQKQSASALGVTNTTKRMICRRWQQIGSVVEKAMGQAPSSTQHPSSFTIGLLSEPSDFDTLF